MAEWDLYFITILCVNRTGMQRHISAYYKHRVFIFINISVYTLYLAVVLFVLGVFYNFTCLSLVIWFRINLLLQPKLHQKHKTTSTVIFWKTIDGRRPVMEDDFWWKRIFEQ